MESSSTRFRPTLPSPEPVFTVTVYVVPLPLTVLTDAPDTPVVASEKSLASTPVTTSLNVTANWTLARFVGVEVARLIEDTEGAVAS